MQVRLISLIIIHCSDSDIDSHDNINTIREWHLKRGFKDVGYHYFIKKDGTIETGRAENETGSHCKGYNKNSIGICFSGRIKFSESQFVNGAKLVLDIMDRYKLQLTDILPHNEFNKDKSCPNFNIQEIIKRIYGPTRN